MTTVIRKWGNSLAFRIPKKLADEAGVTAGAAVRVTAHNRRILITPAAPVYTLRQLLNGVTSKNLHRQTDTERARGAEVW
jgi:antitoxin MazE